MNQPCNHAHTQVISQDDNGKFLECLDCKEIFEPSEIDDAEPTEDLSDA